MQRSDWSVPERRQGEQLGKLVLVVGRRAQFLPMRTYESCLGVLTTQWLPRLRASDPRGQGRNCNVFYDLGNHTLSLVPYFIDHISQP